MKPTPAAYTKLIEEENERLAAASRQANRTQKYNEEQEKGLYHKIKVALADYDDVEIDGHHLIVENIDSKNTIKLYVGKIHWMTFLLERQYSSCSCENHETRTWLTLKAIQYKKSGREYSANFSCPQEELHDPAKVAYAMKKIMNDFNYRS